MLVFSQNALAFQVSLRADARCSATAIQSADVASGVLTMLAIDLKESTSTILEAWTCA